jgi:hypothetical protein
MRELSGMFPLIFAIPLQVRMMSAIASELVHPVSVVMRYSN